MNDKGNLFWTRGLNPFTAPACKVSMLKSAHTPANRTFSISISNKSTFNIVCFYRICYVLKKRERKGLKISNFTLLSFIFNWLCGSQRVDKWGGLWLFQVSSSWSLNLGLRCVLMLLSHKHTHAQSIHTSGPFPSSCWWGHGPCKRGPDESSGTPDPGGNQGQLSSHMFSGTATVLLPEHKKTGKAWLELDLGSVKCCNIYICDSSWGDPVWFTGH